MSTQKSWATYATGIVYGLQPDALFVVVPALLMEPLAALAYCTLFVIGTVTAMGGYTFVIGERGGHALLLLVMGEGSCATAVSHGCGVMCYCR